MWMYVNPPCNLPLPQDLPSITIIHNHKLFYTILLGIKKYLPHQFTVFKAISIQILLQLSNTLIDYKYPSIIYLIQLLGLYLKKISKMFNELIVLQESQSTICELLEILRGVLVFYEILLVLEKQLLSLDIDEKESMVSNLYFSIHQELLHVIDIDFHIPKIKLPYSPSFLTIMGFN